MKKFQQFKEDLQQFQKDLYDLEKKFAPQQRLRARRRLEIEKAKEASNRFKKDS
jgi:Skp family chaperone for outer membrane proteins